MVCQNAWAELRGPNTRMLKVSFVSLKQSATLKPYRNCVTIRGMLLLKIVIRHFDGPVFPYMLHAPRQYTSFYLRVTAERVKWKAYRQALFAAQVSTLYWSNLQTFRLWKPYLYPVFYRTIP